MTTARTPKEVLRELEDRLEADQDYSSGRILGSMISAPHPLAVLVYSRALESNLGDPGLFPGTAEIETELMHMLGELVCAKRAGGRAVGQLCSGGSEANLLALAAAKETGGRGRRVLVPAHAHVSYWKAARLLDLELDVVATDRRGRVLPDEVRRALRSDTLALVGVAGTTDLGAVDPLRELSELACEKDLFLHVDAAFGGFVIPFLEQLGQRAPAFDFRLEGVRTITIDPHKMGLAIQPAGAVFFRDEALRNALVSEVPYLAGGAVGQATLTGTRPGAAALAAWAVMQHLGHSGYRALVEGCLERTREVVRSCAELPDIELVTEPEMNVVGLRSRSRSAAELARALRERGWSVGQFPEHVRLVLQPHVQSEHVAAFVADLAALSPRPQAEALR